MPNFYHRIAQAASQFGDRPAIEMAGDRESHTLTYREVTALSSAYARWLQQERGVTPGARVAIFAANSGHWVSAYLGILRAGAVAVPLDTAYSATQVRTILVDSAASVLFCSASLLATAREATADSLPGVSVAVLDMATKGHADAAVAERDGDDIAAILYTSGTTADPKGVVLTHGNLEGERAAALAIVRVTENDAVLGVLPLFHALAQMANLLLPLTAGARVVFLETVNSSTLVGALETRGITIFACVPQFFYLIHQRVSTEVAKRGVLGRALFRTIITTTVVLRDHLGLNPGAHLFARVHRAFGPRMRMLITGGSRFDPLIARDLHGMGLTLLNGYGLTETSGAATLVRPGDRFTTSVGQPLPGVEVRIAPDAAANADGAPEPGSGEILIRGPIVMQGYFGRADVTAEAFEDGWLRTGDLGHLDANGRVYITGRKKEVIVLSSGKNLYPEEIEAHYRQSPFVKELCVMGQSDPGAPAAERLHAVVVPDEAALRARGTVNLRELVRFEIEGLAVQLPAHKRVLSYDIATAPLPRTSTGKLKRAEIERRHRAAAAPPANAARTLSADDEFWGDAPARRPLLELVRQQLSRQVAPDDHLELDLHLDSMERVELMARLEQRQGTQLAPEMRATIFTIRHLIDGVIAAPSDGGGSRDVSDGLTEWDRLLATAPDAAIVQDLERPAFWRALFFFVALRVALVTLRLACRVRVQGREHLPRQGPLLITPNHQSYLDGFLLCAQLPFSLLRHVFFVGAAEYFQSSIMRRLARLANIVAVDPDANLVSAMQAAGAGLGLGKVLTIFPEGERSIDGTLKPFRKGAAILAAHLNVPVLPVAIDGLYELWPRGRSVNWRLLAPWNRHPLSVTFGPALRLQGVSYSEGTATLRSAVLSIRPDSA